MAGNSDTWGKSGDITVGLYSDKTLKNIHSGKDKWAATVFMNRKTFSQEEIRAYPYFLRHKYVVVLEGTHEEEENPEDNIIEFYATDKENAKKFIQYQYDTMKFPVLEFYEVKMTRKPLQTFSRGGRVRRTSRARLHRGELVVPSGLMGTELKTDRGQGGYFRHRREHARNAMKGARSRRRG